ncbi:MAG: type 1 glutamine amidotransferase [Pseudomonadota bacterium]
MLIGILQTGDVNPRLADRFPPYEVMFARLLDGHGLRFQAWRANHGELPAGPEDADGWLITGSAAGVYEDLPWIAPLEDLVRAIAAARRPLVGICFGHQLMAQALGGRVVKSDKGWGIGVQEYDEVETGRRVRVLASHQDQVVAPPPGAEVMASSEFCPVAAMRWPDAPMLSWQPHPEFEADYSRAIIEMRRGETYGQAFADAALARLDAPLDSAEIGGRLARFFLESRQKLSA